MRENNKVYGWVISMYEFESTIPTLWKHTKAFIKKFPSFLAQDNSLDWLVDGANVTKALDKGEIEGNYNMCHFWSNFEIANLDFFRGPAYQSYFDYLDSQGGFFYERWGDAPVHSLAVSLMLPRESVHHFADIGISPFPRWWWWGGLIAKSNLRACRIRPRPRRPLPRGRREPHQRPLLLRPLDQLRPQPVLVHATLVQTQRRKHGGRDAGRP